MTNIYIQKKPLFRNKIKWVLDLIKHNHNAKFNLVDSEDDADLSIGTTQNNQIQISNKFYADLVKEIYNHEHHFPDGPHISLENEEIDFLSSIFYLVNSIQEYNSSELDKYGRFRFEKSLQYKYEIVLENTVAKYIFAFLEKYSIQYDKNPLKEVWLTHDIDFIYSGWRVETKKALKSGNLFKIPKLLVNRFFGKPIYANIDSIVDRENKYGLKSTFFWLVKNGWCNNKIKNSDYTISDSRIVDYLNYCTTNGCEHGIHKSSFSSTIKEEAAEIEGDIISNRYHFLKINLPKTYEEIEESGMLIDSSLGFTEHMGFRNSYGLPFHPYNLKTDAPYTFLEVPLNIMDGSFHYYMNRDQSDAYKLSSNWLDKVSIDALITILWHNNELTEETYPMMNLCYESLLIKLTNEGYTPMSGKEIVNKYAQYGRS